MRRALLILAFVAIPPLLHAQVVGQPQQITIVDSGTACVTAPTACATFALDSQTGGLTLSISGTWTGTLTFEGTNNDGIWTSVLATNLATGAQATTTTASGLFTVTNAGVIKVRMRATAAVTGTALVTAAKGLGFARNGPSTVSLGGLATTSTDGMSVVNPTPATASATVQISPRVKWCGTAWNSVSVASETDCMFAEVLPATVAGTTTQTWRLGSIINGGAATFPALLTSSGNLTLLNGLLAASAVIGGNMDAQSITFVGSSRMSINSPADGQLNIRNSATTIGSQLKVDALPTVASGFGTSPSITAGSTPLAGSVNVGTGGVATSGVINFNGTAFPSAPFCTVTPSLTNVPTRPTTVTTTQITLTTSTAWIASDVVTWHCISSK